MSLDISATGYVAFRFAGDAFVGFNVAACCQIVFCAVRFACNLDITAAARLHSIPARSILEATTLPELAKLISSLFPSTFFSKRILPLPAMLISSFPIFIGLAIMKSPEDTTFSSFISRVVGYTLNWVG